MFELNCKNLHASGVPNPADRRTFLLREPPGAKVSLIPCQQPQAVINPAVYKLQH